MVEREELLDEQYFTDQFQFIDDVHGRIMLNNLERDAVDTPEFQRLFRISQLGLVEITYQTGNHTRGAHSIGTCHSAQRLLTALEQNQARGAFIVPRISPAEKVLIRLGALLHDIPHGPFSHDIEKKKHLIKRFSPEVKITSANGAFEKHDDYKKNPAFHIAIFDTERSILARVLRMYSPAFWRYLIATNAPHQKAPPEHLTDFIAIAAEWQDVEHEALPYLLFHLFAFEELTDAAKHEIDVRTTFTSDATTSWHLGTTELAKDLHEAWYQPFRHEIIGNTLSADLIDYLARDCARLHINGGIDDNLLRYYVLTRETTQAPRFRCAIDLYDAKRGIVRSDRLNDIFQMLEVRHQIHEKAVYHRMAQSSLAMLSRAVILGQEAERQDRLKGEQQKNGKRPEELSAASLYGFDTKLDATDTARGDVAMRGDEHFHGRLVTHRHAPTRQLARKLAERRLFRPLMIVPGHRVPWLMPDSFKTTEKVRHEDNLRELATILDSLVYAPFFHVLAAAIEGLLRHEFTSDTIDAVTPPPAGSVEAFLRQFATREAALRVHASHRVLFWTLPYKQLFKDPAIVVTTPGGTPHSLHEINELPADAEKDDPEFTLIRDRVASGIADADVRYAQMWKVYVFLSDGLFYSGNIAKLLQNDEDYAAACADGGPAHADHLRKAGTLAARAINAAWHYWDYYEKPQDSEEASKFLNGEPTDHMMRVLINDVLESRITGASASEVKFEQYQHGEGDTQLRCRDIRYRFEKSVAVPKDSPLRPLIEVLKCKRAFVPSEVTELVATLEPDEQLIAGIRQAPSKVAIDQLLRQRAFTARLRATGATVEPLPVSIVPSEEVAPVALGASSQPTFGRPAGLFTDDLTQAQTFLDRAVAARNERGYDAALRELDDVLRIPNRDGALTTIQARAHLLRAELNLDKLTIREKQDPKERKRNVERAAESPAGRYTAIDADMASAAAIDPTIPDLQRVRGIIAWRKRMDAFRRDHPSVEPIPAKITQRGEQESPERQELFFTILATSTTAATGATRQRKLAHDEWNAIAKEAWGT